MKMTKPKTYIADKIIAEFTKSKYYKYTYFTGKCNGKEVVDINTINQAIKRIGTDMNLEQFKTHLINADHTYEWEEESGTRYNDSYGIDNCSFDFKEQAEDVIEKFIEAIKDDWNNLLGE